MRLVPRLLLVLLALFCFANVSQAYEVCQECTESVPAKLYLSPNQIQITDNNILFEFEGNWYAADTIRVDQGGLYVIDQNWRCPRCGRTLDSRGRCGHCRARDKNPR